MRRLSWHGSFAYGRNTVQQKGIIMKKVLLICAVMISGCGADAQTNFFHTVTNLWHHGHKSNVLEMANARLAQNTNDIAGLILKMEYNFEFLNVNTLSNDIGRVITAGAAIQTKSFREQYDFIVQALGVTLKTLEDYLPGELEADRQKSPPIHTPMTHEMLLELLYLDGYFD